MRLALWGRCRVTGLVIWVLVGSVGHALCPRALQPLTCAQSLSYMLTFATSNRATWPPRFAWTYEKGFWVAYRTPACGGEGGPELIPSCIRLAGAVQVRTQAFRF